MKLPIDSKHRISSYAHGWQIEMPRQKNGKVKWEPVSYYTSLENAVNSLGHRLIRESGAETLTEALAEIDRVSATLSRALSPQFKVEVRF